jgi:hypothetical protein
MRTSWLLAATTAVFSLSAAHAALIELSDRTVTLAPGILPLAGFAGTPGQAMTYIDGFDGQPRVVDCAVLAGACTQSTGQPLSLTTTSTGPGNFVSTRTGTAGADQVSVSGSLACTGACATTAGTNLGSIMAGDFQQLMITSALETPIEIQLDITYSLLTTFVDNSVGVTGAYRPGVLAFAYVGEASSYHEGGGIVVGPNGQLTIDPFSLFMEFYAVAGAGIPVTTNPLPDPGSSVVNTTQAFTLLTDTPYWVGLAASLTTVFMQSADYSGLDLSYSAFADPTFSVNAAWAAQNPTLAAGLSLSRAYNGQPSPMSVPEPSAALLLATGVGLLMLAGARSARVNNTR